MPFAKSSLANYMTEAVRDVVRAEVLDPVKRASKVYGEPRIFEDLLSSQPLCFNLFAELHQDLALASGTFQRLLGDVGLVVTAIEFEHSPGRGSRRFTGDHSAFDVFVAYTSSEGNASFVGIEVKYTETLGQPPARHRPRYDEVADAMGCFRQDALPSLRQSPLEQLWRDHLLAGSMLLDSASSFRRGTFAIVYPKGNSLVERAAQAYRACLTDQATLHVWTLESLLDAVASAGAGPWLQQVAARYLGAWRARS